MDFGSKKKNNFSVQTSEGEKISELVDGYVKNMEAERKKEGENQADLDFKVVFIFLTHCNYSQIQGKGLTKSRYLVNDATLWNFLSR